MSGRPVGLAVAALIFVLLPLVVNNPYYIHLLIMVGMNAVLAMTFLLLLRTGLITIAIAGFWGVGAYASALLSVKLGLWVWLALPTSAFISAIVGLVIGLLLIKKGGIGFVMLTLVFGFIVVLVFGTFEAFGGYTGIYDIPPPEAIRLPFFGLVEFTSKTPFYYLMLFLVSLVVLVFNAFYASWTGRAWRAIGQGPRLAESLGVSIFQYRLLAFVIAAAAAGLMGSFFAHYYGSIVPATFGPQKTIYVHVYAILGGIEYAFTGPLVGSLVMIVAPELLRIAKEVEPVFTGLLVILLVMFLPDGLLGLIGHSRPSGPAENLSRVARWVREAFTRGKSASQG